MNKIKPNLSKNDLLIIRCAIYPFATSVARKYPYIAKILYSTSKEFFLALIDP